MAGQSWWASLTPAQRREVIREREATRRRNGKPAGFAAMDPQRLREIASRGGRVADESVLDALLGPEEGGAGIGQVVGAEPTPQLAAQVAEEFRRLLALLPDEEVRAVPLRKMEGYTNAEVAAELGCAGAAVERRLKPIRALWKKSATG
jgi:DNA-directed RNA polymerase specialized sigma24 family protein